ncbi:MAG: hypothetical protein IH878_00130 [Gemmatimonadetes bacterium]|nr:hypothetical protein [Gemmatimonadota bacterium]
MGVIVTAQCRAVLLGSIAPCVFASPLVAQTWSSEQQAVLAVVEQSYVDALGKDATWVDRFTHPEVLQGCWWGLYMDGKRIGYVHLFSPGRARALIA